MALDLDTIAKIVSIVTDLFVIGSIILGTYGVVTKNGRKHLSRFVNWLIKQLTISIDDLPTQKDNEEEDDEENS